jgi:rhamnosyltransferase
MNRILFFVHYNKYNGLSEHVLYLLEHLKHIYNKIVFISNSSISNDQRKQLEGLYDSLISRENKGFDFGAWKDALLQEGLETLEQYDNVTLMNDTCFGPLFDLEPIYRQLELEPVDFWGLTNCLKAKQGMPGTNGPIHEHIQSYFMCFKKSMIQSKAFKLFWNNIKYENNVQKVIQKYETKLTPFFQRNGFKCSVFIDTAKFDNAKIDIAHNNPDLCIKSKVPLLKIKSFIIFPAPHYIIEMIQGVSDYPISIISEYFTEIYEPNTSLFICNKTIPAGKLENKLSTKLKIAIHLHIQYTDTLHRFMPYFDNSPIEFDLFCTTDTLDKKILIENLIKGHLCINKLKYIFIVDNKGRDILSWFLLSEQLNNYDIVGHFHTRKTSGASAWIGITWLQELQNLLLNPISKVIETFSLDEKIGIIISDALYKQCVIEPFYFLDRNRLHYMMNKLWQRMKCKKSINFRTLSTTIMPWGSMFWYRPDALKPLLQLKIAPNEIPPVAISNDITILNCIEHILVYVAWSSGYDYRIMVPETSSSSAFIDYTIFSKQLREIKNGKSYRIGRGIIAFPKLVKKILQKS